MNKILLTATLLSVMASFVSPVQAEGRGQKIKEVVKDRVEKKQEKRAEKVTERCQEIEKRVQERISNNDKHYAEYVESYRGIRTAVVAQMTALERKGASVTALKSQLAELDVLIKQFSTDKATFIQKLKATTGLACGKSDGAFKQAMEEVRAAHQKVLSDARQIRQYYLSTIKPSIKELRRDLESK